MARALNGGLDANGHAWLWGRGNEGGLGDNTVTSKSSPVSVVGAHSFIMIVLGTSLALGLKADGSCWAWGVNSSGQVGDLTITNKSSPVSVVGAHSFVSIGISNVGGTSGHTSFGLKSNGEVWAWGAASNGRLGNQSATANASSPISVVGSHLFTTLFVDDSTILGLKADGSYWGWGLNTAGQIADGSLTSRSSPVAVIGGITFASMANSMYIGTTLTPTKRLPNILMIGG